MNRTEWALFAMVVAAATLAVGAPVLSACLDLSALSRALAGII